MKQATALLRHGGMSGSAAYGDIDSQTAVAVMRNTFDTDMTAAQTVDRIAGRRLSAHRFEETGMSEPQGRLDERFSAPGAGPTPWNEVRGLLDRAQISWISTVRADGRPHVTPLVAVWEGGALYFTTGPEEQKAENLRHNPNVVVTTGRDEWDRGIDVMVEGQARRVTDPSLLERLAAAWRTRWDGSWTFEVSEGSFRNEEGGVAHVFEVRPAKILSFRRGTYAQTRYRFGS